MTVHVFGPVVFMRTDPGGGLGPPGPVLLLSLLLLYITLSLYIYIYSYNIFLLCNWHLQKP